MSQVPNVSPVVPPTVDPPAPTVADIIGTPPPPPTTPSSPLSTPPGLQLPPDTGLAELGQTFGLPAETTKDPAATKTALQPMLEMVAKVGRQQQQTPPPLEQPPAPYQQQQPQQATAVPPVPPEFRFDDLDLGDDATPEMKKAFQTLGERSKTAIQAVNTQALQAQQAAVASYQALEAQQQGAEERDNQKTAQQAVQYLDSLASPKYGVGDNRSLIQTVASEKIMQTAGYLLRGMRSYGQTMPIEQVVRSAILLSDGDVPTPPVQTAPGYPALPPSTPPGPTPPPRRGTGSAAGGGALMDDPEYLAGARQILDRSRR